jgi:serine protease AprX
MNRLIVAVITIVLALTWCTVPKAEAQISLPTTRASVDSLLSTYLTSHPGAIAASVITYRSNPSSSDLNYLRSIGVTKGFQLRELPMVIADLSLAQLTAIATRSNVASVYGNRRMSLLTNASRPFIGCDNLVADLEATNANSSNPGFPITGKDIGIGYIDTGIDGTHKDHEYGAGKKTVQNVIQPFSELTVGDGGLVVGVGVNIADILYEQAGFYFPAYLENQPHTDLESGHGTHGAAVAAGTGEMSGGLYVGVAPGA